MRYIGSKSNLLHEIEEVINKNVDGNENTFLDCFAGTNIVGRYFKNKYTIISNDLLYFSYVNAKATIENNLPLSFDKLKQIGIESPLDYLQLGANLYISSGEVGYYELSYTPTGGAMYLSVENGKRIDFIRDKIDEWKMKKLISEYEYYYLVSVLIESIPYVSNITGTYGAYLKHWDKRALKPINLLPLEVINNNRENISYNINSNELIKNIIVDIAYIDTPYNNRQYASNYHLLENVALNKKSDLKGITRIFEWKDLRSDYAIKSKAITAMSDLIENINATHVIVSYNNEGIITEDEMINILKKNSINSEVYIKKIPFRKYKSKLITKNDELYEIIFYIRKKAKCNVDKIYETDEINKNKWIAKKNIYIKSPLNYVGGKYKLLPQIIPLFPKNINNFIDLFSGGANVGINIDAKKNIFNDMNFRINEMFRYFKEKSFDEILCLIEERIDEFSLSKTNETGYLEFRKKYNNNPNPLDLYILVSFSYNYQIRFNNSMQFNNPFGKNRSSFSHNMRNNLEKFMDRLQTMDAEFTDFYFTDFDFSKYGENDFVYLDPPYLITTGSYNDGNRGFKDWNEIQEKKMYDLLESLTEKGIKYALSNVIEHKGKTNHLLVEFIKKNKVYVNYLDYNYDNSSHNTKKSKSIEVLITNYR